MLITVFDTYLTPRSPRALWAKHFVGYKKTNLKEPYNQDTKAQVTTEKGNQVLHDA